MRLVVHADDFGIAPGVDRAIERAFENGAITSASILLAGTSARDALRWAAEHPEFDYGVHLNLSHGIPVLPSPRVASLVDSRGAFRSLRSLLGRLVLQRVDLHEAAAEWNAQIEAVLGAGVAVSHLDSHHHVHLFPRVFREVAVPLARERGLALRTMDGPAGFVGGRLDATGIVLAWTSRLATRGMGASTRVRGTGTALMRSPELDVLRGLVRRMDPGTTYELVVHPGYADAALRATGDPYVEGREAELALLESDETRAMLAEAGVQLRSLRDDHRQGGGSAQWT